MNNKYLLIILGSLGLCGCKTIEMPTVFDKGVQELPRYGKDATHYECENHQTFGLKFFNNGEDAWVMLPDREVGLVRDSSDKQLYHYGTMDLRLNGEKTTLDDSEHLHLKSCKISLLAK